MYLKVIVWSHGDQFTGRRKKLIYRTPFYLEKIPTDCARCLGINEGGSETISWDLAIIPNTTGLENRRKCSQFFYYDKKC
jgi:hypothetical protein